MTRQHLVDLLNTSAFALLIMGLWRTLFGPRPGESTIGAIKRMILRPKHAPVLLSRDQEQFAKLPPEEQERYRVGQRMMATLTPANQGNVQEATEGILGEIQISARNARWGASLLVLGGACSLAATLI